MKKEQLNLFKEKYEKDFDQSLKDEDRIRGQKILREWQKECEILHTK